MKSIGEVKKLLLDTLGRVERLESRSNEPATKAQRKYLERLGVAVPEGLNNLMASELIDLAKNKR